MPARADRGATARTRPDGPASASRRRALLAALALAGGIVPAPSAPQVGSARATRERGDGARHTGDGWPSRSVRIVVPQAVGGTADLVARMLGERLEAELGAPFVVDNRPGANGLIGTDAAKRSAPDGHTLLLASTATHVMAPSVLPNVTFDPLADFAPVVNIAWQTKVALVSTALPVATLAEFVDYARARPGVLNYASTGIGSSSHLDTELLASTAGIALHHVPYRGSGQTMAAISTGEVHVLLASVTASLGAIRTGQVRALAILGDRRSRQLPHVPTLAEAGFPSLDVGTWLGFVAPAGTPAAIVALLDRTVDAILASAEVRRWFDVQGLEPAGGTPVEFDAVIRADVAKWGDVVRRLGIRRQ